MATLVEQIIVEVSLDSREFNRNVNRVQRDVGSFGSSLGATTGAFTDVNGRLRQANGRFLQMARVVRRTGQDVRGFGGAVSSTNGIVRDSNGRLRDARGRFVSMGASATATGRSVTRFGGKMKGMSKLLSKANISLALIGITLFRMGKSVLQAGDEFDKLNQKLIASTGSSEKANKAWEMSSQLANQLGLDVKATADGYAKFLLSGGKDFGEDTGEVFRKLSVGISGLGANAEETKGIFLAFSQILSKGKVSIEEINQLAERGIGRNLIAEALGVESIENLDIKAPKPIEKIATFLENRFAGASKKGAQSIKSMSNRIANNVFELQKDFNEVIKPFRALFLSLSSTILNGVRQFMPQILAFVDILKNGIAFWLRTIVPISLALNRALFALAGAVWDLISSALQPLLEIFGQIFGDSGVEDFVDITVKSLFKLATVFENFTDSVKLSFLSLREKILETFGFEIPASLASEIDRLDKKIAKSFEEGDKKAKDLVKTLRDASDALLNFKEIQVEGDVNVDGKTPKVDSQVANEVAGAVEFGSTEAFKIIGSKTEKTANQNLKANKETAKSVKKLANKKIIGLDV